MEQIQGLLRIHVIRGVNLAIRDVSSSDPYVVIKMGKQKVKTHVVKHNINPEWNEELTLSISETIYPVRVEVFDKDTFTPDDNMGHAEFDLGPFMEVVKLHLDNIPSDIIVRKIVPNRQNCLAEESSIKVAHGKIIQDLFLRLRDVECGEIELQLEWINIKKSKFKH